jgi:N-acetylmuramoyl-L-alanine amidase-like protein
MAPRITQHLINRNCTFMNQMYPPLVFVVHRTAGHVNVQQLYDYWQNTCISSHFGISYDGYGYDPHDIWQFVNLWDGSGANCCPESGHHPFFDRGGNANVYTITVEVCTPNTGNNGLMTAAQVEALVYLIQMVCAELGIPVDQYSEYWNDYETAHTWIGNNGGIGMHRDVSPHNKKMCPGDPYYQGQMDEIIAAVRGGSVPSDRRRRVDPEMVQITEMNKSVILIPPPGNSMLLIGVDFADANVRVYGHIEGSDQWQNKSMNTRPGYDAWHVDIGPDKWPVDKVSISVTEFNKPGGVCSAVIWPT